MNKLGYLFIASLLAHACASCPSGEVACGQQGCYSPTSGSCPTDVMTNRPVLCSHVGQAACLGVCYFPSTAKCEQGALYPIAAASTSSKPAPAPTTSHATPTTSSTQPPTTSSTTSSTSSSSTVAAPTTAASTGCTQGNCASGSCTCNGGCYQPSQYNCAVDGFTGSLLMCPFPASQACKGQCYDPTLYSCGSGGLTQVGQPTPQPAAQPTSQAAQPTSQAAQPTSQAAQPTPPVSSTVPNAVVNPNPAPGSNFPTQTADLRVINNCKTTLWIEARYGGAGAALPGATATATQALPGGYVDYTVPATGLSGSRFWAKYGCNSVGQNCLIGDQMQYWPNPPGGCPPGGCTPPVDSLFEATWGCKPGTSCNAGNPTTWFDTSQVDGWTIPYKLTANGDTQTCDCAGDVCGFSGVDASQLDLTKCPQTEDLTANVQNTALVGSLSVPLASVDLRLINNGSVLGCLSPCKRLNWGTPYGLNQPESSGATLWMCCPTPTPDDCTVADGCVTSNQCRAGPIVNTQYVAAVHTMAPGVYSYSYDDGVGLHACAAGVVTYTMEFCPAGSAPYPAPL